MEGDIKKLAFIQPVSRFISKTAQDTAIVTKADKQELIAWSVICQIVPFPLTLSDL